MGAEDLPLPLPLATQRSQTGEHPSSPHSIPWAPPGRPWLDQQLEQSTTSFPSAPPNCVWQGPAAPRPSHRRHGKQQEIIIVMAAGFCVLPEPAPELSPLLIISSRIFPAGRARHSQAPQQKGPPLYQNLASAPCSQHTRPKDSEFSVPVEPAAPARALVSPRGNLTEMQTLRPQPRPAGSLDGLGVGL